MLRKRIIGVVNVLNGWAVQSFNYNKYLPLGKAECLVENLDRWGADEILVQAIDRSRQNLGPDFGLLKKIAKLGIGTPIIYSGGIRNEQEACEVIQLGADRLAVDSLLHESLETAEVISEILGAQALIASLPLSSQKNELLLFNHKTRASSPISPGLKEFLTKGKASEVLISDHLHEGGINSFDEILLSSISFLRSSVILFGGITDTEQMKRLLANQKVSAIACGNSLSYEEMKIQKIKEQLSGDYIRKPVYAGR